MINRFENFMATGQSQIIKFGLLWMLAILTIHSCQKKVEKKEAWTIGLWPCNAMPPYSRNTGLDPAFSALSTSEKKKTGLVLINVKTLQTWQHPSWSQFGSFGPIASDEFGNSFIAPVPVINVLSNKPNEQNVIYKVNGQTAEMSKWVDLPFDSVSKDQNPYGLVGLHYDCHGHVLFASTLMGSDAMVENGRIFIINTTDGEVLDELKNIDAIGIGVCGVSGEKRLYYGAARTSNIYSIEISKDNKFMGEPRLEIEMDMLGPRGDDKARKISFMKDGTMMVKGVAFDFNLTAPTEKLESTYLFDYDRGQSKWIYRAM